MQETSNMLTPFLVTPDCACARLSKAAVCNILFPVVMDIIPLLLPASKNPLFPDYKPSFDESLHEGDTRSGV